MYSISILSACDQFKGLHILLKAMYNDLNNYVLVDPLPLMHTDTKPQCNILHILLDPFVSV